MKYFECIARLNSLQKAAFVVGKDQKSCCLTPSRSLEQMAGFLNCLGYNEGSFKSIPQIIHVTGTKGKGSTSNMISQIIQAHNPNYKVALYTSPHLRSVRERIRINGLPISEECFSVHFSRLWERLCEGGNGAFPGYFRFLTLLGFDVFLAAKVNVLVLEVGIGGRHDCTNVVPFSNVAVVTNIGFDHVELLGNTLQEICWEKVGIVKEGSLAVVSCRQDYAETIPILCKYTPKDSFFLSEECEGVFPFEHQNSNAATALKACELLLKEDFKKETAIQAVKSAHWPGRNQIVHRHFASSKLTFYLDGAHTKESLATAIQWFKLHDAPEEERILCFNCTGKRNLNDFSQVLGSNWKLVVVCSVGNTSPECFKPQVELENDLIKAKDIQNALHFNSPKEFEAFLRQKHPNAHVLVTGSLHLVGSFMEHFDICTDKTTI